MEVGELVNQLVAELASAKRGQLFMVQVTDLRQRQPLPHAVLDKFILG